jgi:hypothetical protein
MTHLVPINRENPGINEFLEYVVVHSKYTWLAISIFEGCTTGGKR